MRSLLLFVCLQLGVAAANGPLIAAERSEIRPSRTEMSLELLFAGEDGIFADGFESGDTSAWSQPCSSCVDCANQACIDGTCGSCILHSDCCDPFVCLDGTCILF